MRSPGSRPARAAGLPGVTSPMTGWTMIDSEPTMLIAAMNAIAITTFMNGPATRIRNLCHFGFERNSSGFAGWFSSGVSPAMRT